MENLGRNPANQHRARNDLPLISLDKMRGRILNIWWDKILARRNAKTPDYFADESARVQDPLGQKYRFWLKKVDTFDPLGQKY